MWKDRVSTQGVPAGSGVSYRQHHKQWSPTFDTGAAAADRETLDIRLSCLCGIRDDVVLCLFCLHNPPLQGADIAFDTEDHISVVADASPCKIISTVQYAFAILIIERCLYRKGRSLESHDGVLIVDSISTTALSPAQQTLTRGCSEPEIDGDEGNMKCWRNECKRTGLRLSWRASGEGVGGDATIEVMRRRVAFREIIYRRCWLTVNRLAGWAQSIPKSDNLRLRLMILAYQSILTTPNW